MPVVRRQTLNALGEKGPLKAIHLWRVLLRKHNFFPSSLILAHCSATPDEHHGPPQTQKVQPPCRTPSNNTGRLRASLLSKDITLPNMEATGRPLPRTMATRPSSSRCSTRQRSRRGRRAAAVALVLRVPAFAVRAARRSRAVSTVSSKPGCPCGNLSTYLTHLPTKLNGSTHDPREEGSGSKTGANPPLGMRV